MKWFVRYGFPYPKQLSSDGYEGMEAAAKAVDEAQIPKWNVELKSESFGCGGCHRAVWRDGQWVNPRYGTPYWG